MMRTLEIEIIGNDWYIEEKKCLKEDKSKNNIYFANSYVYKNKIRFLHDFLTPLIKNELEYDDLFLEACTFRHKSTIFEGTFIDAFSYIKDNFKAR